MLKWSAYLKRIWINILANREPIEGYLMRRRDQRKWNRGFTLVETLAAVAVLVILLGLGSVAVAYYRESRRPSGS